MWSAIVDWCSSATGYSFTAGFLLGCAMYSVGHGRRFRIGFALLAVLILLVSLAKYAAADTLTGQASVIDGDTLEIHGQRIRLWGIDAPESSQLCKDATGQDYRCGQRAALALSDWLGQRMVTCEANGKSYDRVVAVCSVMVGDGLHYDIGAWLVRNGWSVDWERYSKGWYAHQQRQAEAENRGIWAGPFNLEKSKIGGE